MKKPLVVLALLVLSACGGGEVNCSVPGACVLNINGDVNLPGLSASAPAPVASAPVASVPRGAVNRVFPVKATPGNIVWRAGGMTYTLVIVTNGDAVWCAIYSAPVDSPTAVMTSVEAMVDSGVDLHAPASDDASIKAWVAAYVVPKANAWIVANSGRFASGMTVEPYSRATVPAALSNLDRAAGLLPQFIEVTPFGISLK